MKITEWGWRLTTPFRAIGRVAMGIADGIAETIITDGVAKIAQDIEKQEAKLSAMRLDHARAVGFNIPHKPKGPTID